MRVEHPFRSAYNLVVMRTPVEVQLVVTRRCNLACPYCYEHNPNGELIPFDALVSRIDAIHALGTVNLALLGGEPLLHPRIADIVRYAARRCQVSMTTNGFLLSVGQILALNHAGLSNLQISIDTLKPDPARSMKSLSKLRRKLLLLADLAAFDVHVTVVLAPETLDSFRDLIDALREFPFRVSTNLVHDEHGMVKVQGESYDEAWDYHFGRGRPFSYMEESYGRRLLRGERPPWRCQAGSRFLYVDEFGMAQLCSAQTGRIGKHIEEFTRTDLRAWAGKSKGCEQGCSILCVYRDSMLDNAPLALLAALAKERWASRAKQ